MKKLAAAMLTLLGVVVAVVATTASAGTAAAHLTMLGTNPAPFAEDVDVAIVYVGIEPGEVDAAAVEAALPEDGRSVIRYKRFYGLDDSLLLDYSYSYSSYWANPSFESDFVAFLTGGASRPQTTAPTLDTVTVFQEQYNAQTNKKTTITSNRWVDAPKTEAWLAARAASDFGIDPARPTLFFIDAREAGIHTYVKVDVEDPDTGYNFGEIRSSRKMTAWGGTFGRRAWFYDLSAGPEGWSDNWNVDDADLDADGVADYRIPPIWHYTGATPTYNHPGYGDATLTTDIAKVAKYVGLDLLFTSSPLYPPWFRGNRIPSTVELDINTVEGWSNVDASARFTKPALVHSEVSKLPAGPAITLGGPQDLPFSGDWNRCYKGFSSDKKLCFNDLAPVYAPFANLFLASARNQRAFLDNPDGVYEAALINYAVGIKPKSPGGLLGFADDNWLNGTQSGIYSFVYPEVVPFGYGLTTTMIHEYGHHSSMSHPHDGFDPATDTDFGPGGDTQFVWIGDMSHTIMAYLDLVEGFGQFDLDNSARHHAAGYRMVANAIVAGAPGVNFSAADADFAAAQDALAVHNYGLMLAKSKSGYEKVVAAVGTANINVLEPSTWTIAGPIKPGNGNKNQRRVPLYVGDLDEKKNAKRVYSK